MRDGVCVGTGLDSGHSTESGPLQVPDKSADIGSEGQAVPPQDSGQPHDGERDEGLQQGAQRVLPRTSPAEKNASPSTIMNPNAEEVRTQAVSPLLIIGAPTASIVNTGVQIASGPRDADPMEPSSRVPILPLPEFLRGGAPLEFAE